MISDRPVLPADFPEELPDDLIALRRELGAIQAAGSLLQMLQAVTADPASRRPLLALKASLITSSDQFERLVLYEAARQAAPEFALARLAPAVRRLWREEITWLVRSHTAANALLLETQLFEIAAKIVTLRRFPAGPMDWELSGIPLGWLRKTGLRAPRLAYFMMRELGGRGPLLFLHMARKPRNRGLILESEVMRMYHRLAQTLRLQREVRGIMTAGWFNDPAAVADSPHLAWVNQPFFKCGGFVAPMEWADASSGVTEGNQDRKKRLESGELRYRIWLVVWPREKALAWADANPQWAE